MDDFDFEDWWTGGSYVEPGMPVDVSFPDITKFNPQDYLSDVSEAFSFGDVLNTLGPADLSEAFSFGDLNNITGGIEGAFDVADIVGQGTAGIPGIEGFADVSDIVGQGTTGIPGIEGMADVADIVGQGTTGVTGIEGMADVADIVGQGTAGIPGIEGFAASADEVGRGTTGITGIEGFAEAADEVGRGTTGTTGLEGFAAAADEVGQGVDTRTKDPFEVDGAQGSRTEETATVGTTTTPGGTPGGKEVVKTDTKSTTQEAGKNLLSQLFGGDAKNQALMMALIGGILGLLSKGSAPKGPVGYQGAVPKYTSTRGQAMSPTAGGRRPGGAGIPSLTGGYTLTKAAGGGLMGLSEGGRPARYLRGGTDGMADKIQTSIDGKQPARLSHGEFVIPADVVSHLGNGNSDAGADVLYDMMAKVRKARTGTPKQGKQINPRKYTPA